MEKINVFISLVNKTYFNNEKELELKQLYQSIETIKSEVTNVSTQNLSSKPTCTFIMKSGSRKGEACGKGCMKNNVLCSLHKEKPDDKSNKTEMVEEKKTENNIETVNEIVDKVDMINTVDKVDLNNTVDMINTIVTKENKPSTAKPAKEKPVKDKPAKEKPVKEKPVKDKPVKEKKEKQEKQVNTEPCKCVFKTGERIGQVCGDTTKSCPHQKPIHIRKCDEWSVLTGTNVLFDKKRQVIIGYNQDDKKVFEENDEVRSVCITYDLAFSKPM